MAMHGPLEKAAIVVHGGAGAGRDLDDGCRKAADAAQVQLAQGKGALAAAVPAVVVLEDDERFNAGTGAVAGSTGGSAPSLLGRVGDTPIVGSGFYAGPEGAVAASGVGEYIIRHMLASTVYQWIAAGMDLGQALQRGIDLFPKDVDVGLIAVSRTGSGACSNAAMPQAEVSHA